MSSSHYNLTLNIEGPFVTAGVGVQDFGIDTATLRNHQDVAIIPGTLLQGVVRQVLEAMSEAMVAAGSHAVHPDVDRWFGARQSKAGSLEPARGRIRFSDLLLTGTATARHLTRIKIDDGMGTVQRGMLQVIESPIGVGEEAKFVGTLRCDVPPEEAVAALGWIKQAVGLIPSIGSIKGAGFGQIIGLEASKVTPTSTGPASVPTGDTLRYALQFAGPFLVGSEAISGNLFKGASIVPGAAVKGALANELNRRELMTPALEAALDAAIFRHAKPCKNPAKGPRALPLSLYAVDSIQADHSLKFAGIKDALVNCPAAEGALGHVVAFRGDWKDGSAAQKAADVLYRQSFSPAYDIRTRTAVDKEGTAETGQLFSRFSVKPDDHIWVGEIERGGADTASFNDLMTALTQGLSAIGKLRTEATVKLVKADPRHAEPLSAASPSETWRIVLESDALLHGPGEVFDGSGIADPSARLSAQYRAYFASALELPLDDIALRFYARQRWIGGYQAKRFPHYNDQYFPQLLTEAGSVFELTLQADVLSKMTTFARFGLPLPPSVPAKDFAYLRSPFNPENGYGEVTIESRKLTDKPR